MNCFVNISQSVECNMGNCYDFCSFSVMKTKKNKALYIMLWLFLFSIFKESNGLESLIEVENYWGKTLQKLNTS